MHVVRLLARMSSVSVLRVPRFSRFYLLFGRRALACVPAGVAVGQAAAVRAGGRLCAGVALRSSRDTVPVALELETAGSTEPIIPPVEAVRESPAPDVVIW